MTSNLNLLEQLFDYYLVKSLASKYLYTNDTTAKILGYHNRDDILGIDDREIKCPAVAGAEQFMREDLQVTQTRQSMLHLDLHEYQDGQHILMIKKVPYFEAGELIGLICGCTEYASDAMMKRCFALMALDQQYYFKQDHGRHYQLTPSIDQGQLSSREMDCLFYLLRNKSAKAIARRLDLSYRTVEWHIANVRLKLGCNNKTDLIERAVSDGYLQYLPLHLLMDSRGVWPSI